MANILVVDDEAAIRSLMRATLTMAGHHVTEASGGEEAIAKIKRTPFELVLLDLMMPITDGYEVLDRIRAMPSRAHMPVIVVTAKSYDPDGIIREASAGAVDHISKPFDPTELQTLVNRTLASSVEDLEERRHMLSRGASLYHAVGKMRELARETDPLEDPKGRPDRRSSKRRAAPVAVAPEQRI